MSNWLSGDISDRGFKIIFDFLQIFMNLTSIGKHIISFNVTAVFANVSTVIRLTIYVESILNISIQGLIWTHKFQVEICPPVLFGTHYSTMVNPADNYG